jgi:hypothetical protein
VARRSAAEGRLDQLIAAELIGGDERIPARRVFLRTMVGGYAAQGNVGAHTEMSGCAAPRQPSAQAELLSRVFLLLRREPGPGEPRAPDKRLAKALEYADRRDIRQIAEMHSVELATYGIMPRFEDKTPGK